MSSPGPPVDLTNCDREPIHLLGAIQPFGFLIAVSASEWFVQRVSGNVGEWLGVPVEHLLGRSLVNFFNADAVHTLRNQLHIVNMTATTARIFGIVIDDTSRRFDIAIHTVESQVIIECEPSVTDAAVNASALVRAMMSRVQMMREPRTLSRIAAREMRALTGFDRVMVYRFAHDGSGEVIAESATSGLESFLGLHYPASDIPRQARILYERNWLRIIPDIETKPVPIESAAESRDKPLDLSQSILRSVSPIHIEYLHNMGVRASMSVSILREGRLWGLFACHHYSPLHVTFERRTAAELFGQMFSLLIENRELEVESSYENRARELHDRLVRNMVSEENRTQSIPAHLEDLADLIACDGVGLALNGQITLHGMTPDQRQFASLIEHIRESVASENYSTNEIRAMYPAAAEFQERAAGMLVMPLSRMPRDYLVFFRREVARTVNWAGDPTKPMSVGPLGSRLTPRKSFELWRETVTGQALPWTTVDCRIADGLRVSLLEVILHLSDQTEEERRRAIQRQDLLIAELNHRVRNILGLIRGLINQSRDPTLTAAQFTDLVNARIQAMARAHDLITADHWGPALFSGLLESEGGAYLNGGANRLQLSGPDARLHPNAFTVVALVIHEMLTNSAKYGALSDRRGNVTIETKLDADDNFIIEWRERGGPPVQAPKRRGFGSTVIERTIPYDLKGEARIDYELSGVRACFLIPAQFVTRVDQRVAAAPETVKLEVAPAHLVTDILLVEDSLIIALDAEEALRKLGVTQVRTANSVTSALALLEERVPKFALLDVNLGSETSFEVASKLLELGVPFAFMTGYGENSLFPGEFANVPRIRKPFSSQVLATILSAD
ncbi:MAG: HWE histidine kinase domain-containing protein [Steroidobacter sp.]